MLRLQTESVAELVFHTALPCKRPVQEIAGIKLHARLV